MIEQLDGVKETVRYPEYSRVRFYHNVEKEGYPLHWHAATEIIMPLRKDYSLNIQNKDVYLSPGDILWIAPGILHTIDEPEPDGERLIILFDPTIMNQFKELSTVFPFLSPSYLVTKESFPESHVKMQECLTQMLQLEYADSPLKNVLIYAELIRLASHLGNAVMERLNIAGRDAAIKLREKEELSSEEETAAQQHLSTIYESLEFIREHSREDITLDQLADEASFSKFYYSRLFKSFTGMSFIDYLNSCRISDAEMLLSDPEASITEVAMKAGFNSISTFNRVFKKYKNCTPSEFKQIGSSTKNYSGIFESKKE